MKLTLKEAKEKNIFFIEDGEVNSTSLVEFVYQSVEETTTPLGVGPRVFLEEKTFEIDRGNFDSEEDFLSEIDSESIYFADELRNACIDDFEEISKDVFQLKYHVISSWGIRGNNYSSGMSHYSNVFLSEDKANDELFRRTYEYDFIPDDRRDTTYFNSEEEANDALVESISYEWNCDVNVTKHILRKQKIISALREERKNEIHIKEKERVNSLAIIYSKMVDKVSGENYQKTAKRLSDAIGQKIESKVFHAAVKLLRN